MENRALQEARRQKDEFFKRHDQSPLTPAQRAQFDGLHYYDYNPDLDLNVRVEPFGEQKMVPVQTTTGQTQLYLRYGQFTFAVDGQEARLTIYEADHGYFLPFVDANAGTETYPAGRYLEPERLGDNLFHVDFNQAYNPYCAYSPDWSCPITPAENRLRVAVRAGEKMSQGEWVNKS